MILLENQLSKEIAEYATQDEATQIISILEKELQNSPIPGIGLAAPQIGINKAVAIVRIPNKVGHVIIDPTEPMININLVNPSLIEAYDFVQYNEGCLSFPGQSGKTIRYDEILLETMNDYEHRSVPVNAKRYGRTSDDMPLFGSDRRRIQFGQASKEIELRQLEQLVCICVQHEFSHLLGLTMFDFKPLEVGRNDICPCGSGKKNKKCHNYSHYNKNLEKLFNPKYKGV